MTADYSQGRCCAMRLDNGKRCNGRWSSASPVQFAWDPVKGDGIDGPWAVFCCRHRHWSYRLKDGRRYRVWRGWIGAANKYGYGTCVFRGRTGWKPAALWWSKRRATTFGQPHRTDAL